MRSRIHPRTSKRTDGAPTAVVDPSFRHADLENRRNHVRYPVSGRVLVFHPDRDEPFAAFVANISCGGAFIRTFWFLPEGTKVRLVFGAGGLYDLVASVVRTFNPSTGAPSKVGFAVRFDRTIFPASARRGPDRHPASNYRP